MSPPSIDTIEHFRPKAVYPQDAYRWTNLYFCCMHCQQKDGKFNENALQPDAADYTFERYFRWDYTLGRIEVNEQASPEDQVRALITIALFRLNVGHPSLRRRELRRRSHALDDPTDDFAYRDYIAGV